METLRRKKLRTVLEKRFPGDPVAVVALKEYELDQRSERRVDSARAELIAIHQREMQNLREAARGMLEATVIDLTTKFEARLEDMTRGTDEKIEPVRGKAKSMSDRMDALESLLTGRHGKLSETVDRLRKRVEKFTDYVVGAPNRSFYVNGSLPSAYFSDTNLVAGTGITLTPSTNQTKATADILITASGGGGFTFLPATGAVNSVNPNFTFTQEPTYIVSDGAWYTRLDNNGAAQWTWDGVSTATMVVPPNGSIFGVA